MESTVWYICKVCRRAYNSRDKFLHHKGTAHQPPDVEPTIKIEVTDEVISALELQSVEEVKARALMLGVDVIVKQEVEDSPAPVASKVVISNGDMNAKDNNGSSDADSDIEVVFSKVNVNVQRYEQVNLSTVGSGELIPETEDMKPSVNVINVDDDHSDSDFSEPEDSASAESLNSEPSWIKSENKDWSTTDWKLNARTEIKVTMKRLANEEIKHLRNKRAYTPTPNDEIDEMEWEPNVSDPEDDIENTDYTDQVSEPSELVVDQSFVLPQNGYNGFLLQCEHCPKQFAQERGLNIHISRQHKSRRRRTLNNFGFSPFGYQDQDQQQYNSSNNTGVQSVVPNSPFMSEVTERTIQTAVGALTVQKDFRCEQCPSHFDKLSSLRRHATWKHKLSNSFTHDNSAKATLGLDNSAVEFSSNGRSPVTGASIVENGIPEAPEINGPTGQPEIPTYDDFFTCPTCPRRFATYKGLKIHITFTHKRRFRLNKKRVASKDKPVVKKKSAKSASPQKLVEDHEIHYDDAGPSSLIPELMVDNQRATRKKSQAQTENYLYRCEHCPKLCATERNLKIHITHMHKTKKSPTIQDKNFTEPRPGVNNSAAASEKLYLCHLCPKEFTKISTLSTHLISHRPKPRLPAQPSNRSQIMKTMLQKLYICNRCPKRFERIAALTIHKARVHNPLSRFQRRAMNNFMIPPQINYSNLQSQLPNTFTLVRSTDPLTPNTFTLVQNYQGPQLVNNQPHLPNVVNVVQNNQTPTPEFNTRTEQSSSISVTSSSSRSSPSTSVQNGYLRQSTGIALTPRPFKCDRCPKSFARAKVLSRHKRLNCPPKRTFSQRIQESITNSTAEDAEKTFTCNLCAKSYATDKGLKIHKTHVHQGDKRDLASSISNTPNNCTNNDDSEGKPYHCKYCPMRFSHINGLSGHMRKHKYDKLQPNDNSEKNKTPSALDLESHGISFNCPYSSCPEIFPDMTSLNTHLLSPIHVRMEPAASSSSSGSSYQDAQEKQSLTKPRLNNAQIEQYKCVLCPATFSDRQLLATHVRSHSAGDDKPFKCQFCDKAFKVAWTLKVHSRTHSGDKQNLIYCPDCNNTFSGLNSLEEHKCPEATETPEMKPFPCHYCKKTFRLSSFLEMHMLTHTNQNDDNEEEEEEGEFDNVYYDYE